MDENAVDDLERGFGDVLVGAVDRIAGLESDDALPAALGEHRARLLGVERELGEGRLGPFEDRDLAREVVAGLAVEARNTRVGVLARAEAQLGLVAGVVGIDLGDLERREQAAVLGCERDALAFRGLAHGECDRQRPERAVGESHLLDRARIVGLAHEPTQGRERAARDHVEVGELARAERDRLEPLDALRALPGAFDERAAVWGDQPAHAATAEPTSPRCSR